MATTANTPDPKAAGNDKAPTADAANIAASEEDLDDEDSISSSLPAAIECTARKQFYSAEGALVEVGQAYVWKRSDLSPVFPWPVLEPTDESVRKACEADYKAFKRDKLESTGRSAERNRLLARLAEVGVD